MKGLNRKLVRPNIRINGLRTSISLDPVMWDALREIAEHQGKSVYQLVTEIEQKREPTVGLTAAIRIYIVEFYRTLVRLGTG